MRNNFKRFLSVALVLMMAFAVMTVSAFATEETNVAEIGDTEYATLAAAIKVATAGDTITLLDDVTEDVTISKNLTINGAGKTYTGKMNLTNRADITIKNVNFEGKGKGYAVEATGAYYVTIEDCTAKNYYGFVQVASATVLTTVKNVTVSNVTYGIKVDYSDKVTLENVTVKDAYVGLCDSNYGEKTYTITNCKFNAEMPVVIWERTDMSNVTTLNFVGVNDFGTDDYLFSVVQAEGNTIKLGSNYCKVNLPEVKEVAAIGTKKYATLAEAVAAAKDGDVITVLADHTLGNTTMGAATSGMYNLILVTDKAVTIDLNGKTITANVSLSSNMLAVFGTNNTGELTLKDSSEAKTGTVDVTMADGTQAYSMFTALKSSKMYIESGNYSIDKVEAGQSMMYVGTDKQMVVSGGDFYLGNAHTKVTSNGQKQPWICNGSGDGINTIVLKGGRYNVDPTHYRGEAHFPAGYEVIANADETYSVVESPKFAIGTKKYAALADAVAAAKAGQTIKLLRDASGAGVVINKNITIDFNDYTYTLTSPVGSKGTESNGLQILVGNTVKLMDGTLKVADEAADKFYILVQNYANLTVNGMTLDGTNLDKWSKTDGDSYVLSNNSGKVVVNSKCNFIVNDDGDKAWAIDACKFDKYPEPTVSVGSNVKAKYIEAAAKIGNVYYATLQQAIDAAADNATVSLYRNVAGPGVVIKKNITINFGSYTYTLTSPVGSKGTESNGFQIHKDYKVTLKNGKLEVADEVANKFYILVQNYSNLTVTGMTLDGTNLDKWSKTDGDSYTLSNNSGIVTVNGKSKIIENDEGALSFAMDACDKTSANYTLPEVTVDSTVTIDGDVEAAAKVGNTYYASLQEAIAKVNAASGTITLFADANLDEDDVVKTADGLDVMLCFDGKNVTLDLNGKMINVDYDKNVPLYSVVHVADGVTLSVNDSVGNGGIELKTGATKAGKYDCVYYMFWKRGASGRLNINDGNYHANNLEDSMVYTNGNNAVTVKGGKFVLDTVGTEKNGSPWIFNTQGQNERKIVIYGGTFNADVFHQYWFLEVTAAKDLALQANGDGTYTVVDAAYYVTEYYYYGKMYSKNVGYTSLEEAEAAAAKNTEISKKVAKIVEL